MLVYLLACFVIGVVITAGLIGIISRLGRLFANDYSIPATVAEFKADAAKVAAARKAMLDVARQPPRGISMEAAAALAAMAAAESGR